MTEHADETARHADEATGPADETDRPIPSGTDKVEGAGLFALAADEKLRVDAALEEEIDREASRRFPGYSRPVVVAILIAEGAAEAGPKWTNDRKHLSDLTKGYVPPKKLTGQVRVLNGSQQLVSRVAKQQYHGAPGQEVLTASLLLRLGLTRSTGKRPSLDPAVAVAATMLSKRSR